MILKHAEIHFLVINIFAKLLAQLRLDVECKE